MRRLMIAALRCAYRLRAERLLLPDTTLRCFLQRRRHVCCCCFLDDIAAMISRAMSARPLIITLRHYFQPALRAYACC